MRVSLAVLVTALLAAAPARANVSNPVTRGGAAGEYGGIAGIAIEHEDLAFDLRPLAEGHPARVTATYRLANRGPAITAPLAFYSGARLHGPPTGVTVSFDGAAVPSGSYEGVIPDAWKPPAKTPSLDGGDPEHYSVDPSYPTTFTIVITPGTHRLEVSYVTQATSTRGAGPAKLWQLGYVLAPARDWASFGTLDITVEVPPGWDIATSPELARDGDTLRGSFTGLPGDTVGITTRVGRGLRHTLVRLAAVAVFLLAVAGGFFWIKHRRRPASWRALVWGLAVGASALWVVASSSTGIPEIQNGHHGYGHALFALFAVFAGVATIPIGIVVGRMYDSESHLRF